MLRHLAIFILCVSSTSLFAQGFAWMQQIGNINNNSGLINLNFDKNNNMLTAGGFHGTIDFDQSAATYNMTALAYLNQFLLKEDASGNFLWAKNFEGTATAGLLKPQSICLDTLGNIYITGNFQDTFDFDPGPAIFKMGTLPGYGQTYIMKLDSSGNLIWAKQIGNTGAGNNSGGKSIKVDKYGNVYTAINFSGTIDVDPGPNTQLVTGMSDILILKLDASGNFLWSKQLGGSAGDIVWGMATDSVFNIYLTGYFQGIADYDPGPNIANLTSNGNFDIFVAKYDSSGNYIWAKSIGGSQIDEGDGITVDLYGNVLVAGYYRGTVDFDPGPGVYNLPYGASGAANNPFVLKLDNAGNFKWAKTFNSLNSWAMNLTTDSMGNVYSTGMWYGGDFNPPLLYTIPSQGGGDVFVDKMDSSGNMLWVRAFGTNGDDAGSWIGLHGNSVYITGILANNGFGTGDCDPGAGVYTVTAGNNGFIEKLDACPSPTASISGDTEVCEGTTTSFTLNNPIIGATDVKWLVNHIVQATNTNFYSYVPVNGDTVSVLITIPTTLCYDITYYYTNSIVVQVDTNIIPSISITAPSVVNVGQQVTVTANVVNAGTSYNIEWRKNGAFFTTTTIPSLTYTKSSGTDTITAIIYPQSAGCYGIAPSNYQIIASVNGIQEISNTPSLQIFPNPSTGIFNFESTSNIEAITITDVTGKTIYQVKPNKQKLSIDLSQEASGVYLYQVIVNHQKLMGKLNFRKEK